MITDCSLFDFIGASYLLIMAKDPAFLFYPGDWLGGTMTFSRLQRGAYIDLLMAQFHSGPLSIDDVKHVLGDDFISMWEQKLKAKFETDENGKFFNERLFNEQNKRKSFSESRRNNLKKPTHTNIHMNTHMVPHMENEDVNVIDNLNNRSVKFQNSWKEWIDFRKEIKKPYKSQKSIDGQLKELSMFDDDVACQMIQQSITKQWQGIFPLKFNNETNKKNPAQSTLDALNLSIQKFTNGTNNEQNPTN